MYRKNRIPDRLPPGYVGNRFTVENGAARPVSDSGFVLSVDGILQSRTESKPTAVTPRQNCQPRNALPDVIMRPDESGGFRPAADEPTTPTEPPASKRSADAPKPRRRAAKTARRLRERPKPHRPERSVLSSLTDGEDLLLILLIFLLSGEEDAGELVRALCFLLAVR